MECGVVYGADSDVTVTITLNAITQYAFYKSGLQGAAIPIFSVVTQKNSKNCCKRKSI